MTNVENPLTLIFFGLPGSGKSTAGKVAEGLGFYIYHADQDYTQSMQEAMRNNLPIQEKDRDNYYQIVAQKIGVLQTQHPRLVIDHWFPRERHRVYIKRQVPDTQFILITTSEGVRIERLTSNQRENPISQTNPEYYIQVARIFEIPMIPHSVVVNNTSLDVFSEKIKQIISDLSSPRS